MELLERTAFLQTLAEYAADQRQLTSHAPLAGRAARPVPPGPRLRDEGTGPAARAGRRWNAARRHGREGSAAPSPGWGALAADLRDWHRAAVLDGAEHALMDQIGARWNPFGARRRQDSLDQAGTAPGDEQFRRAYAHGTALGFDQAIDLAPGGPDGHVTGTAPLP